MQQRTSVPASAEITFAEFYRQHAATLLSYIRRYISTREDAEDILVEVSLSRIC